MGNEYNQYFRELLEYSVGEIRANGYSWYKEEFEKKLFKAAKTPGIESKVMSQAWMVAGDIWDINRVPLHAMLCYREALEWNAENYDAYYELAKLYISVGSYKKAAQYAKKAMDAVKADSAYKDLYYEALACIDNKEALVFSPGDVLWLCSEKLAIGKFKEVILQLENVTDTASLQIKAQCYGALGDSKAYLQVWTQILESDQDLEILWADWFYMPEEIIESAAIWEMFIQMIPRIKSRSVFEIYDLGATSYEPEANQMRELSCLFRIYSAKKSVGGLKTLLRSFPNWVEVKNELSYLKIIEEQLSQGDSI